VVESLTDDGHIVLSGASHDIGSILPAYNTNNAPNLIFCTDNAANVRQPR